SWSASQGGIPHAELGDPTAARRARRVPFVSHGCGALGVVACTQPDGESRPVKTTNIPRATAEVPFVDLGRNNLAICDKLRTAFDSVLQDGGFVLGEEVDAFEAEFADYCGVGHCVGVGSGTAALTLALLAAGVQSGDEVIVPAHTYIARRWGP